MAAHRKSDRLRVCVAQTYSAGMHFFRNKIGHCRVNLLGSNCEHSTVRRGGYWRPCLFIIPRWVNPRVIPGPSQFLRLFLRAQLPAAELTASPATTGTSAAVHG